MRLNYIFGPFAILYAILLKIRHYLYDHGIFNSQKGTINTISIGNLSMGGSGKTPMIDYLAFHLKNHYKLAILSRGYGRSTKGYKEVSLTDHYSQVGDEPLLLKHKQPDLGVFVDRNRVNGIHQINSLNNPTDIVLLDDAMQHRALTPSISILLTDYHCIFTKDQLVPMGTLRDLKSRAKAADIIVVTKAPKHIEATVRNELQHSISKYSKAPVFFSKIQYGEPKLFFQNTTTSLPQSVFLISGIANHRLFENYIKTKCIIEKSYHYRDHFPYTEKEITQWIQDLKKSKKSTIITTEKDAIRFIPFQLIFEANNIDLVTIPIRIEIEEEDTFLQTVKSLMDKHG